MEGFIFFISCCWICEGMWVLLNINTHILDISRFPIIIIIIIIQLIFSLTLTGACRILQSNSIFQPLIGFVTCNLFPHSDLLTL